jgi:aspartyl/glutamyl-tRNA(Asn/Gln) amidotransferase C subunit
MTGREEVQKLAALARISIPDEKLESFVQEFERILAYVGTLDELSLPTHTERSVPAVRNVIREDGTPHEVGKHTATLTGQFSDREGDHLRVQQIISHD